MLARIQSFFSREYRPLPTRPVADASNPAPPTQADAGAARGAADALARWTEIIEHRAEADPVFHRIDVAECLGAAIRAIGTPACERPVYEIGRLLGSAHLLQAVMVASSPVAVEYSRFAEDIQTAYLVALGMALSHDCLQAQEVLDLLVGRAGRARTNVPMVIPAYAHHVLSLATISERHAFTFAKMVDHAICKNERDDSDRAVRLHVRRDLLVHKGYGAMGRSNFYSALALGEPSLDHARLLRMLVVFDLLPLPAELALKGGRRGRDLEAVLTALMSPSCEELRGTPQEEVEALLNSFESSLFPASLETLREQHRTRIELASARARELEDALMATGLR
ncbi:hypothetical protein [Pararobbsia alpina]|uniref:Uncharacterized protein n=1 Tax=Pararobbsia alpina TaxID=621374 RepID=A0A6S7B419_9BURK|nr:hypothetical protein [Pararobbsia alpina]CAB3778842.1 hypothetical protein LMG28138_00641 [Pararobbsia alpina]